MAPVEGPADGGRRWCKDIIRIRSDGRCERCGVAQATNGSHRVREGQGGLWVPSNVIDMCGSGTTGCHGFCHQFETEARETGGWMLRSWQDPLAVPWLHWMHGWVIADDTGGFQYCDPPA